MVFRSHGLFEPAGVEFIERAADNESVVHRVAVIGIDRERIVVADAFAHGLRQLDVVPDAEADLHLDCRKAGILYGGGLLPEARHMRGNILALQHHAVAIDRHAVAVRPPSSLHKGSPAIFPERSHSAMSTPDSAWSGMPFWPWSRSRL